MVWQRILFYVDYSDTVISQLVLEAESGTAAHTKTLVRTTSGPLPKMTRLKHCNVQSVEHFFCDYVDVYPTYFILSMPSEGIFSHMLIPCRAARPQFL